MSANIEEMLNASDDDVNIARRIASECEAFCQLHELEAHGGQVCQDERINLIAFLCHRVGVLLSDLPNLQSRISAYSEHHRIMESHNEEPTQRRIPDEPSTDQAPGQ
jgi:hypothetical protein